MYFCCIVTLNLIVFVMKPNCIFYKTHLWFWPNVLAYLNVAANLLLFLSLLGQYNGQYTVFYLGRNFGLVNIVGQDKGLLKL